MAISLGGLGTQQQQASPQPTPEDPTQPPKPVTKTTQGPQLPSTSQAGGVPAPVQSPTQAAVANAQTQTADPLAFAPTAGPNTNLQQAPTQTLGGPAPTTSPVQTLPGITPAVTQAAPTMSTTDWTNYSPLAGLNEQQKAEYWAGQGVTGLASGATPTGSVGNPNAGGSVATYGDTSANDARLAQQGRADPALQGIQSAQDAARATYSGTNQAGNDASNQATWAQYANGLNGQQGNAGSGNPLLDPSNMPGWFTGNGTAPGQGGAFGATLANPLDANHQTPTFSPSDRPAFGGPTSGTTTTTNPVTNSTSPFNPNAGPSTTQSAVAGPNAGVGLTATDPNNPLTAQTIAPNGSVDRVKNFQDSLNSTIQNVLNPAFNARSRDIAAQSFGAGRGVSGMNRTSQGNLASDYGNQIKDLTTQGLMNASTGSIDDMYKNLGIAQQQQGFQAGQENNAFNQQAELAQLQDSLTNSAFGRSQAQENAGYANDPSNIGLILSQIFGNQASAAGNAAAGAFGNAGHSSAGGGTDTAAILAYLRSLGLGGTTAGSAPNANPQADDGQ